MGNEKKSILNYLKKKIIAISILVAVMITCLTIVSYIMYVEIVRFTGHRGILFLGLIGMLAAIMIMYILYQIYKEIFFPLDELYQGIAQVGMNNKSELKISGNKGNYLKPVTAEVNDIFLKLKYLITLIENLNKNESFTETVSYIYSSFTNFIPYRYIGIALIEDDGKNVKAYHGVSDHTIGGLPENLFGYEIPLEKTTLGEIIKSDKARIINDLEDYVKDRPYRKYNEILLEAGIRSSITLPLIINERPIGFIFFSSSEKNVYQEGHIQFLKTLANSISLSLEKNKIVDDLIYSSVLALAKLAESRDNDTGNHLHRMKSYSRLLAELLYKSGKYTKDITLDFVEDIERFSPLHDIGKVGIKDGILLKPGKLTTEEFDIMKQHTIYGAQVLQAAQANIIKKGRNIFNKGIEIAENHHEKWDGSGYPMGKKGKEIPLSARIVTVGDVFDALTSKRSYKKAFAFEDAFQFMKNGKGSHFDPDIIDILVANKKAFRDLYEEFQR